MADYTLAVGTHDPLGFAAATEDEAIRRAADYILNQLKDEVRRVPQEVVTLMGPGGLITRPAERADEFVQRAGGANPAGPADVFQPGDTNTPDCNGD
jgi:hypothetical protein